MELHGMTVPLSFGWEHYLNRPFEWHFVSFLKSRVAGGGKGANNSPSSTHFLEWVYMLISKDLQAMEYGKHVFATKVTVSSKFAKVHQIPHTHRKFSVKKIQPAWKSHCESQIEILVSIYSDSNGIVFFSSNGKRWKLKTIGVMVCSGRMRQAAESRKEETTAYFRRTAVRVYLA